MTATGKMDALVLKVVESLSIGMAIADPESWDVLEENVRFFEWFPPLDASETNPPLNRRLPELDEEKVARRLEAGRPLKYETEIRLGAKNLSIEVRIRLVEADGQQIILAEAQDMSGKRQAEYLLESYSELSERKTRELEREKDRVERLLLNIMPKAVYEELRDFGTVSPQRFDDASVLMLDFVSFTDMAISREPGALIAELNDIFSTFDRIVDLFGCERIKTIGDAYMAVSGVPERTPEHAHNIAKAAIRIRRYLEKRNAAHPEQWIPRIGIHSGPVVGSIVGVGKYVYDIFGPGVNLAARMESLADPMTIRISDATRALIQDDFQTLPAGEVDVKGFGLQETHTLEAEIPRR